MVDYDHTTDTLHENLYKIMNVYPNLIAIITTIIMFFLFVIILSAIYVYTKNVGEYERSITYLQLIT